MKRFAAALVACLAALFPPGGAGAAEFYAGKTITMATPTGPGGGYDTYLRLLGAHMGRHIPGDPNFIVINQPGAGGIRALNYAGRIAPKDGTFITMASQGSYLLQATGGEGFQVSMADFKWIGNFVQSNNVIVTWHTSPVKTLADARARSSRLAATGPAAVSSQVPLLFNALARTQFEVIRGYADAGQMNLAMERGEVDGRGANMWATYKTQSPNEIRDGKFNAVAQLGLVKEPDLPNVPLLADLVQGDPKKEAIARFVALSQENARAIAVPPGVPDDRVRLLREAFAATMKDPQFLAAATRARLEISPQNGEEVQAAVLELLSMPKDVVDATKAIISEGTR
jgi:tripartite-type tricarboxylate transporter receptor subunit TctC